MATPAAVRLVRSGLRRHSFNENWVQVILFALQRFGRLKPAGSPGGIKAAQQTNSCAEQDRSQKHTQCWLQQIVQPLHRYKLPCVVFDASTRGNRETEAS